MKTPILAALFVFTCALTATPSSAADQTSLLLRLPPKTSLALEVSDFSRAVTQFRQAQTEGDEDKFSLSRLQQDFGLDADELSSVAAGKAWRVDLALSGAEPRRVLALEIAEENKARQLLEKEASDSGNTKDDKTTDGAAVYRVNKKNAQGNQRQLVRLLSENYLVLADDLAAGRLVLERLKMTDDASTELSLGKDATEELILATDNPKDLVVNWLADPWVLLEQRVAGKHATKDEEKYWKYVKRHGYNGIKAHGGSARMSEDGSVEIRSYLHAPTPREFSLRMLTLKPTARMSIPDWLAAGADDMLLLNADVPLAFSKMDRVFDDLLGEGVDGTYREILQDIKAEDALDIDLEKDFYPHLGPRLYVVRSAPQGSPGKQKRQMLLAIETKNVQAIVEGIRKLMEDDEEGVSQIRLPNLPNVIWKIDAEKKGDPQPCLTVMHGHAIYATDFDLLKTIAAAPGEPQRKKAARINELLGKLTTAKEEQPCLFSIRGSEVSADDKKKKSDAHIRGGLLGAFFSGGVSLLPEKSEDYLAVIDRLMDTTTSPVIVGYVRPHGWLLTGSADSDDADK